MNIERTGNQEWPTKEEQTLGGKYLGIALVGWCGGCSGVQWSRVRVNCMGRQKCYGTQKSMHPFPQRYPPPLPLCPSSKNAKNGRKRPTMGGIRGGALYQGKRSQNFDTSNFWREFRIERIFHIKQEKYQIHQDQKKIPPQPNERMVEAQIFLESYKPQIK